MGRVVRPAGRGAPPKETGVLYGCLRCRVTFGITADGSFVVGDRVLPRGETTRAGRGPRQEAKRELPDADMAWREDEPGVE